MAQPLVSVIIPAYNNAEYLGETIQSVLNQTYSNLEVMVVNDASPDNVHAVVQQFNDARIKYIRHEKNQGLSAARNTGIRASIGEIIALLDGDDLFHPEKLQVHVEYLEKHPKVGVTYNPRFELNHSSNTIRELWWPPSIVALSDLVCGFPFSPSDMVLRRDWVFRLSLFDESYTYVGEDLDINCRLALAGCKFGSV
jgi:glycosyltransferase involved in cell wall biosynthesis